jgi:hypothetical protein
VAGAVGGVVNALLSENGFLMPKWETIGTNDVFRIGFVGNMFVSGIAASISWGLYGPFAAQFIVGGQPSGDGITLGLTLSALVGAMLVGIAGARWVTNELDKVLLRTAASEAAKAQPDQDKAAKIALASPVTALKIAQNIS